MILEILAATRSYDKRAPSIRHEQALKAILGKPRRPQKLSDGHRDEDDAFRVMALMQSVKTPKGKKISLTKACEEIARKRVLVKLGISYKLFGNMPADREDIDDIYTAVKSRAKALSRRVRQDQPHKKNYYHYHVEKILFEETDHEEVQMILDIFERWKQKNVVKGQDIEIS